ncbi:MAG: DUF4469 domain-containing protein [Tannerella sp.]|jgi:hypothetical protein|nr:DUF4469 domain-containing protein [Tannerella sp.]
MSTIKAIAHLNELTKDVANDYYLMASTRGTLHTDDIIRRMEEKEIATRNVNGKAFVQQFLHECLQAVGEDYNVVTDLFHAGIRFNGVVYAKDLGHHVTGKAVNAHVSLTQGEQAREAMKELTISVAEQPAPTGPVIQSVTNPVTEIPDTLDAGDMVLIRGMRIAVRGNETEKIGVYFTTPEGTAEVRIPATHLSPNTATRLQFVLPADVKTGQWKVRVATQSTANTATFTKDVREYVYPNIITVV